MTLIITFFAQGGSCIGPVTRSEIQAKFGWSRCAADRNQFEKCSFPASCLGGANPSLAGKYFDQSSNNDLAKCDTNSINGSTCNEQCNVAYVNGSRMCHACASGYSRSNIVIDGRCDKCPEIAVNVTVAVLGVLAGLGCLIAYVRITIKDGGNVDAGDGVRTILLSFLQHLSLLTSFNIAWPEIFVFIFQVGGAVTVLGEHLINVKCGVSTATEADVFYGIRTMWSLIPFILVAGCSLAWTCVSVAARKKKVVTKKKKVAKKKVAHKRRATIVAVLYLIWPALCTQTFSMFSCRKLCGDDMLWLMADLDEQCFVGRHLLFVCFVAVPSLLLYVVAMPAFSMYMIYRLHQRELIKKKAREELKGHLVFGLLYDCYRREVWWWESTIAVRKIIIALIGVFGSTMSRGMQTHLVLMLLVLVMVVTGHVRPFAGERKLLLHALDIGSLVVLFLTLWAGSVFTTFPRCYDVDALQFSVSTISTTSENATLAGPRPEPLAWCEGISIIVGLVAIGCIVILVGFLIWFKVYAVEKTKTVAEGAEEEEGNVELSGGFVNPMKTMHKKHWSASGDIFFENVQSGETSWKLPEDGEIFHEEIKVEEEELE